MDRRPEDVQRGPVGKERAGRSGSPAERQPTTPSTIDARQRDEVQDHDLVEAVDRACRALADTAAEVLAAGARLQAQAKTDQQAELSEIEHQHRIATAIAGNRATQTAIAARTAAIEATASLAPAAASAPWADVVATSPAEEPPAAVRIGAWHLPPGNGSNDQTTVPLVVPILNAGNLLLRAQDTAGADVAASTLMTSVVRLLASVRPGELEIHCFDPRLRGTLAPLARLRDGATPILAASGTDEDDLAATLSDLTDDVGRITELLGGQHANLGQLESQAGESGEPYRVLVVFDYPRGFGEQAIESLRRLMERGPRCGLSVLLHHDATAPVPRDTDPAIIAAHAACFAGESERHWTHPDIRHLQASFDPPPPMATIEAVSTHVASQAKTASAPNVPLATLLPAPQSWFGQASGAHLLVPIGKTGLQRIDFTLGDSLDQLHNVLVGGAVGQGKSNVLLTILHSLAATYPPSEVEFFLLDFKEGLEFAKLGPSADAPNNWLPHATVLGLESDRLFGLAVLRHVRAEFDRRATAFKEAGASDVATFRAERPDRPMPRWLVVLDEFQVLFERKDAITDEAIQLLDTLARKGRAYGIHLLLASQTLSGIEALVLKEDSIFSQFPVRIALKTTPSESQVLLQQGNVEASRLRYRGEAVFNRESGNPENNRRVTIAHADPDFCREIRAAARARYGERRPFVFRGTAPAELRDVATGTDDERAQAVVGMPVAVLQEPVTFTFSDESGRHLILIGPGSEAAPIGDLPNGYEALATLQSTCLSLGLGPRSQPLRFVLLDLLSEEQRRAAGLSDLAMTLQGWGHDVELVGRLQLTERLAALRDELAASIPGSPQTFIVGWGLHRATGLDTPDPISLDRPIDVLHQVVKDGPTLGYHLIAWWNSYKAYEQHIESNFEIAGLAQGFVFLRAGQADVANVVGPFVEWQPEPNRMLVFDRSGSERGTIAVPFRLLSGPELQQLTLRAR